MEAHHLTRRTITLSSRTSAPMHFCHSTFDVSIHPTYLLRSIRVKSASVMSLTVCGPAATREAGHSRLSRDWRDGVFGVLPLFLRTCGLTPNNLSVSVVQILTLQQHSRSVSGPRETAQLLCSGKSRAQWWPGTPLSQRYGARCILCAFWVSLSSMPLLGLCHLFWCSLQNVREACRGNTRGWVGQVIF